MALFPLCASMAIYNCIFFKTDAEISTKTPTHLGVARMYEVHKTPTCPALPVSPLSIIFLH